MASGADTDPFYLVNSLQGSIVELRFNNFSDSSDNTVMTVGAGVINRIPKAPTHLVYLGGIVYAADTGGNRVVGVDPTIGLPFDLVDFDDGVREPSALATTGAGNILVGNYGNGNILEVATDGTVVSEISSGVGKNRLRCIAVDGAGDIYVGYGSYGKSNGRVSRIVP